MRNEAKNKSGQKAETPARHPPPRSGLVQLLSEPFRPRRCWPLSQTALHDLQDYLLNRIAHLRLESQASFFGNCCRRGGLSHYWPAVYPRCDIARFASLKATSSSSTRSLIIRANHFSTFFSLCNLARNAARAAKSAGRDKAAGFTLRTLMGLPQAESSSACDSTILSISSLETRFLVDLFFSFITPPVTGGRPDESLRVFFEP